MPNERSAPAPYWSDDLVTLYLGDARELLPHMPRADAIITDPPYGASALAWDAWPPGWPALTRALAPQMWCFGSMRMFLHRCAEFEGWKFAQDVVWEKHNGSGFDADRFKRLHELALHFYQGAWQDLYRAPQYVPGERRPSARIQSRDAGPHRGHIGSAVYEYRAERMQGSVIRARSCHGYAVHPTQKPEAIVYPLLLYSVPPGGLVLDPFAGSGTTLAVARKTGRRAIGIEADAAYCRAIVERLSQRELHAT